MRKEGGATELLRAIKDRYRAPGVDFPRASDTYRPGFLLRIAPDRVGGNGPWTTG